MPAKKGKPDQNNWPVWVTMIPQDERDALRDELLSKPITDYDSFIEFSQRVLAEVLSGNIPPEVAESAKTWGEMVFASITARSAQQSGGSFIEALIADQESSPKQIAPTFSTEGLSEAGQPLEVIDLAEDTG